jgi:nucleotide-binding universal stress UspA family protein
MIVRKLSICLSAVSPIRWLISVIARILCPLTLSDGSRRIFEHAIAMGRCYRAEIIALHVFARWLPPGDGATYPGWMRQVPQARAEIDQDLQDLLSPANETDLNVRLITREGDPARETLECAALTRADLIVLGADTSHHVEWLIHCHSIAGTVVGHAPCPVLVVSAHAPSSPPFTGYRHVVTATDFSEHAELGLTYAGSIAEHMGIPLTLVHVIETANPMHSREGHTVGAERATEFERADGILRRAVSDYDGRASGVSAAEIEGGLLVLGVRGTRTQDPRRIGATTAQLLKCPPCPMLTVPHHQDHV